MADVSQRLAERHTSLAIQALSCSRFAHINPFKILSFS